MPDPGWVIEADVASVDSPDRVAMIRPDRPELAPVILEDSGAAIWANLSRVTPMSVDSLARDLGIPTDAVESFLTQLADLGFVHLT